MKTLLIIFTVLFIGIGINAQDLEVAGKAKIFIMDYDNTASDIVIREFDGTLGRRSLSTFQTKRYVIGDFAHGGIVFWVDETGEHGLVCAISDQSTGIRWHAGTSGSTQAKGDGPGAGKNNTAIIIASQAAIGDDGELYAARISNELFTVDILDRGSSFNHGDWYLPSKRELGLMYLNRVEINEIAEALSAFGGESFHPTDFYWSSSEFDGNFVWRKAFVNAPGDGVDLKSEVLRVRAVRTF